MKTFPIVKNIFFVIGVLSSIGVVVSAGSVFFLDIPQDKDSENICMDGSIIFLDTQYINDTYFELIHQTTGFSDKVDFLQLYKGQYPSNKGCVDTTKIVSTHMLDYGPEHGTSIRWPIEIRIEGGVLLVNYTNNEDEVVNIANINPVWAQ